MKTTKGAVSAILFVMIIGIGAYGITMYQRNKSRGEFADRVFSQNSSNPPQTIEELKAAIAAYEKRIERHVEDAAKTGSYWKLLAVRFMDRGLYGEALEALEQAIIYVPEDAALHCNTGIAAGIMAKSVHVYPGRENMEREKYYALAEKAFLRSIELDSRFFRPRYGLGVLYAFELDRPGEAISHLEKCLEISRNDVDTMFVLARAHFMLRNFQSALDLYDRIITLTRDDQKRLDAQNNRQLILEQMYG